MLMDINEKSDELVSIIVPVYKVECFIGDCIQSVINQSYNNIELILIDDAGGDSSIDIAKELLSASTTTWRVISNKVNRGVSYCRNIGVQESQGNYIFFLDSDDYISKDCIAAHVRESELSGADMVFGSFVYVSDGKITPTHWCYNDQDVCTTNPLLSYIANRANTMPCNRLIKKQFYKTSKIEFIEGIRHEDEPWSFSLIIRASKISFISNITYYYRQWSGSFMHMTGFDQFRAKCLFRHLLNCTQESYNFDIWKIKEFRTWYARLIFYFCCKVLNSRLSRKDKKQFLDEVFSHLRIPEQEMNEIRFYLIAKKMSFLLPNYRWLGLLAGVRKLWNYLKNII